MPDTEFGVNDFLEKAANHMLKQDSSALGAKTFAAYCKRFGIIYPGKHYDYEYRRHEAPADHATLDGLSRKKPDQSHTSGRYTGNGQLAIRDGDMRGRFIKVKL